MSNSSDRFNMGPLFDSWHTDEKIGEGSFGIVYKVSKQELGETYNSAVKVITVPTKEQFREAESSFSDDKATLSEYFEGIVKNIIQEIRMLYSLSGTPNIIGYQDHKVIKRDNEVAWDIFIRMEFVTSLRKYLKDHSMTVEDIVHLGIDICTALETCSKKGIIHRDIKDENIFVSEDGVFKLGDFGIARELSKSGRAASMRGTPLYMAPEIFRGEKYDAAVDIYSLGIVLYKLLNYGRMPFMPPYPEKVRYQDSEDALEKRISGAALPNPSTNITGLSEIVLKACAFSPIDRYFSAEDMKQDLKNVLKSMSEEDKKSIALLMLSDLSFKDVENVIDEQNQTHDEPTSTVGILSSEQRNKDGRNKRDKFERTAGVFSGMTEHETSTRTNFVFQEKPQSLEKTKSKSMKHEKARTYNFGTLIFICAFYLFFLAIALNNQFR